jgi:NADH-quinone oxidoreductase subunit L
MVTGLIATSATREARHSRRPSSSSSALHTFLLNKWYFDELYDFLFVRPALARPSSGR